MKVILQDGPRYIIRFDAGEEVVSGLVKFAEENNITGAVFSGIGACSRIDLGFFNTTVKDYRKKPFYENREIISLNGNIAMAGGKPVVHAHGLFSDNEFNVIAGHVFEIVVSVTCEISLTKLEGQAGRILNSEFNLKLLE